MFFQGMTVAFQSTCRARLFKNFGLLKKKMPPKETKTRKKSVRKDVKDGTSSCDVRALSDARLGKILGKLRKNAEDAMSAEGLPEKTKKAMERVCALAQEAIQQQPVPLHNVPKKRTSAKLTSRRRVVAASR
jgi:hypothetical protein